MADFIELHVLPGMTEKVMKIGQIKALEKHPDYTIVELKDGTTIKVIELYSWILSQCASAVIRYISGDGKKPPIVYKWEFNLERRHWQNGRERSGQTF